MSTARRKQPIHGNGAQALTPNTVTPAPTDADLLRQEITHLHDRIRAQSHALQELNRAIQFAFKSLHEPLEPLIPKPLARPARKRGEWR